MSKESDFFPDEFQNMKGLPLWKCRFRWGGCSQDSASSPAVQICPGFRLQIRQFPSWFPLLSRLPEFSLLHVRFVSGNTLKGLGKGFPGSWLSFAFSKASLTTVLCNVMILPWDYHYSKSNTSTFWVSNVDKAKVLKREPQSHFSLRFGKRCLWQPDSRIFQLCTHGAETGVLLWLALGAEVAGTVWCWARRGASSAQEL